MPIPTTEHDMNSDYEDSRFNDSNNGFWDRPADERAERMRAAAERGGAENFFDLPPEERAAAYDGERH